MRLVGGCYMQKKCYEIPDVTFFVVDEDVILGSTVLDDGDKGIGYDTLFGE